MSSIVWSERGRSASATLVTGVKQSAIGWISGANNDWIVYLYAHFYSTSVPAEKLTYCSAAEAKTALEQAAFLILLTKRLTS